MKQKLFAVILAVMTVLLCACAERTDTESTTLPLDLAAYAQGKEYKGALRKDGVFIGAISEDGKTMKLAHRGGVWILDYVEGYEEKKSAWAVIADNETPDDYADDIFIALICQR